MASLGCNSLNSLVGEDSSRGGSEDSGVSSTVGAPAAVSFPSIAWIVEAMLVGRPGGYGPRDIRDIRSQIIRACLGHVSMRQGTAN